MAPLMHSLSLALGTPYTRVGASHGYLESLHRFASEWGGAPNYRGYFVESGCSYGRNRNIIVARAIEAGAEWVLQVDDDIRFPPDLPERLLDGMTDVSPRVLIGAVPIDPRTPVNVFAHPDCLARDPALPEAGGTSRAVNGFGGAVMLVHSSVYAEMSEALGNGCWYLHEQLLDDGIAHELEPDLSFARRLKRIGVTAWARYGLPITHSKPQEYRYSPPEA